MKFSIYRNLTKEVYGANIKFEAYGSEDMTEQQEQKIIEDFGPAAISTNRKYIGKYVDGVLSLGELAEDETGIQIEFVISGLTYDVCEGMDIVYSVPSSSILLSEAMKAANLSKYDIARLRCEIFIMQVKDMIESTLAEWKKLYNEYDVINPEEFTV